MGLGASKNISIVNELINVIRHVSLLIISLSPTVALIGKNSFNIVYRIRAKLVRGNFFVIKPMLRYNVSGLLIEIVQVLLRLGVFLQVKEVL